MAFTSAGGREYYTDILALTSGATNCVGKGRIKGILTGSAVSHTFTFPTGTVQFTPAASQIIPFSPLGVTFASGTSYALY
jgi:hypothetical protein